MNSTEILLEIVLRFSDLKWSEFRDDLIVKCMKALRRLRDGKTAEDLLQDKRISSEIEDILPLLETFARSVPAEEVTRTVDALGLFVKAPAPCKTKIIALLETLSGRKELKEA